MTATEKLRELLDERGVEWKSGNFIQPDAETQWGNNRYSDYPELPPFLTISNCAPEQAIAATLGGVPDEIELTQTYDAGFRNGVMAVFQQLEGIEDYEGLQDLIAEYWGEGEGNDER